MNQNNLIAMTIDGSERICNLYKINWKDEKESKWILPLAQELADLFEQNFKTDIGTPEKPSPAEHLYIGLFNLMLYRLLLLNQRTMSLVDKRNLYLIINSIKGDDINSVKPTYIKRKMRDFSDILFKDITSNKESCNYVQPYYGVPVSLVKLFSASAFGLEKPKFASTTKTRRSR